MKSPVLDILRPATVEEAVTLLADHQGAARILAGGQSLVPMLNLRLAAADILLDTGAIEELHAVNSTDQWLRIGARVTHANIEDGLAGDPTNGMLSHVARDIAYRAVRNRGSIGGSLAHADPAADWPVAVSVLGAEIEVAGPNGRRRVPADAFFVDVFATDLAEDEMITAVLIPAQTGDLRWSYQKMRKKAGAFGEAIAAVVQNETSGQMRVYAGSSPLGGPRRLPSLEARDAGALATVAALPEFADLDRYEKQIHKVCVLRAMSEVNR